MSVRESWAQPFAPRFYARVPPRKSRDAARAAGESAHDPRVCTAVRLQRAAGDGGGTGLATTAAVGFVAESGRGEIFGGPVLSGAVRAGFADGAELCRWDDHRGEGAEDV